MNDDPECYDSDYKSTQSQRCRRKKNQASDSSNVCHTPAKHLMAGQMAEHLPRLGAIEVLCIYGVTLQHTATKQSYPEH